MTWRWPAVTRLRLRTIATDRVTVVPQKPSGGATVTGEYAPARRRRTAVTVPGAAEHRQRQDQTAGTSSAYRGAIIAIIGGGDGQAVDRAQRG